ncbi:MAG: nucleotidyltransferase domain-containing protein, partial [Thiohalocapsa sp.]
QSIVDALVPASLADYGDRLLSVAVFGSVARGTMRPDSDVDLLLVVEHLPDGRMPRVREFKAMEQRLAGLLAEAARHGVHTTVSPIFKTPRELEYGRPLFLDMTDEVLILYDSADTLQDYRDRIGARLQALGARRIPKGGGYYRLLKPDLKPCENVTL